MSPPEEPAHELTPAQLAALEAGRTPQEGYAGQCWSFDAR